ncbi:MAG: tetratricopeptide repeat protein [Streptosporangiales bacterium]
MTEAGLDPTTERARLLLESGRFDEARSLLREALARDGEDAGLWCLLSLALIRVDEPQEATSAAARAAALEPAEEWPHRLASIALVNQKRPDQAVAAAREAVRCGPALWQTHAQLALALHETRGPGASDEAWYAASHATALAPEEAETHFVMGVVAQDRGQLAVAERAYRQALSLEPTNAAAMNNLALVELRLGRVHQAAEGFTSSLRADPGLGVARANVEVVGWRLLTFGYYIAFAGFWVLRLLVGETIGSLGGGVTYAVRAGVGALLVAVWAVLGRRTLHRLPVTARRYLLTLPRRQLGFGLMVAGVGVCVLGSLFGAFAPASMATWGLYVAAGGVLASFVTSWVVVIRNRKKR